MMVYIVMRYDSHEYHVGHVYYNKKDAEDVINKDLMHFDYIEEREVRGLP